MTQTTSLDALRGALQQKNDGTPSTDFQSPTRSGHARIRGQPGQHYPLSSRQSFRGDHQGVSATPTVGVLGEACRSPGLLAGGRTASAKRRTLNVTCNDESEPVIHLSTNRHSVQTPTRGNVCELGTPLSLVVTFIYEFDSNESESRGSKFSIQSPTATGKDVFPDDPELECRADTLMNGNTIRNVSEYVKTSKKFSTCSDRDIVKCRFQLKGWAPNLRGEGWLGFIVKRTSSARSAPEVTIGIPFALSDLALTGRQWAYGVAARQGQLHICAVNLGLAFWFANTIIDKMWKELRLKAKKAKKTELVFNFGHGSLIKWICRGTHPINLNLGQMTSTFPVPEDHESSGHQSVNTARGYCKSGSGQSLYPAGNKFSVKSMKEEPIGGYIRQDLSFSISVFRSIFSEATGLKAGYVPLYKFTKGYRRHIKQKADKAHLSQPVVQLYSDMSVSCAVAEARDKLRVQVSSDNRAMRSGSQEHELEAATARSTYRSLYRGGVQDDNGSGTRGLKRICPVQVAGAANSIKVYLEYAKKQPDLSDQTLAICPLDEAIFPINDM